MSARSGRDGDGLREDLARLVRRLLEESHREAEPIGGLLAAHLGVDDPRGLTVHGEELPGYELANLQLGIDAALDRPGWSARVLGLAGPGRSFSGVGLSDLLTAPHHGVGPPEYVNVPAGPGRVLACLESAMLLVSSPAGPVAAFLRRGDDGFGPGRLVLQATAPDPAAARALLADVRRLMAERDCFRGQVIAIETDPQGGQRVAFLERPRMTADELVLPAGVLERIERHVLGPSRHPAGWRRRWWCSRTST